MSDLESSAFHAELRSYVAGIGPVTLEELRDDVSLIDQGAVDSRGLVEIQLYLEQHLNREIQPDELDDDTLLSISAIVRWLESAGATGGHGAKR